MYLNPELLLTLSRDQQRELIVEADRQRLLAAARRQRRARARADAESGPPAQDRPAGTLAPCGPRASAPARR